MASEMGEREGRTVKRHLELVLVACRPLDRTLKRKNDHGVAPKARAVSPQHVVPFCAHLRRLEVMQSDNNAETHVRPVQASIPD